jgi:hypothetical protein
MLMSFDTRITSRCGKVLAAQGVHHAQDLVVGLALRQAGGQGPDQRFGLEEQQAARRLVAGGRELEALGDMSPPCWATSASSVRLVWRPLRATSVMPFLWPSSSSSTIMGRKMSCSSKRNRLIGSCSSTLVSSTNRRAAPVPWPTCCGLRGGCWQQGTGAWVSRGVAVSSGLRGASVRWVSGAGSARAVVSGCTTGATGAATGEVAGAAAGALASAQFGRWLCGCVAWCVGCWVWQPLLRWALPWLTAAATGKAVRAQGSDRQILRRACACTRQGTTKRRVWWGRVAVAWRALRFSAVSRKQKAARVAGRL